MVMLRKMGHGDITSDTGLEIRDHDSGLNDDEMGASIDLNRPRGLFRYGTGQGDRVIILLQAATFHRIGDGRTSPGKGGPPRL